MYPVSPALPQAEKRMANWRDVRKLAIPAGTGHRRLLCRLSFIFLPVFWGVFVFAIAYQGPPDACAGGE